MHSSYIQWNYEKWPNATAWVNVRAMIRPNPPWVFPCARLMMRLNLTYQLLPCSDFQFSKAHISSCVRGLMDGKYDMTVGPESHDDFRNIVVDFTRPVVYFQFGTAIKKQYSLPFVTDLSNGKTGTLLVVWAVMMYLNLLVLDRCCYHLGRTMAKLASYVIVLMAVLQSGTYILYGTLITTDAMSPLIIKPFHNLHELCQLLFSGDRRLMSFKDSNSAGQAHWEYMSPLVPKNSLDYVRLDDYLHRPNILSTHRSNVGTVAQYLERDPVLTYLSSAATAQFKAAVSSSIIAIIDDDVHHFKWYSYMLPNGSSLRPMLNDVILSEVQNMKYANLIKKYVEHAKSHEKDAPAALRLEFLYMPMLLLAIGHAIGLLYFLFIDK